MVFNTGPYTVLPDNSILISANMQSETGFPSSHQLKSYVVSKSRLKLAARAVLSADADLLVAAHAHAIATCFAVVSIIISSMPSLSLNSLLGTLSFTLILHIYLTILISAR